MKIVGALVLVVATAGLAAAPAADIEQQWLEPGGRGSSFVGNGRLLAPSGFRAGVAMTFGHGALRTVTDGAPAPLVETRVGFQVFGAIGVLDWLQLSALVPVVASQDGAASLALAPAGLGTPWLYAKVGLLGAQAPVSLAVDLGLGVPVGTAVAQGNGGVAFQPRVQAGRVFREWQLASELGLLLRAPVDYAALAGGAGTVVGSQVFLSAAIASVAQHGPRGELSVRAFAPLAGGRVGVEAQLGLRWQTGPLELFASAGPGFGGAPATPDVRACLGVAMANTPPVAPACVEGPDYALADCPELDRDGDGVPNGVDRAPLSAEDRDGFQDDDGAPDPDDDADGVLDADDRCVRQAGPAANGGCPDTDADGDGVVDRLDACRDAPEDRDDFEDADGCPEPDNDGDGLLDGADACPGQAGIAEERGCPAKDSDGDAVSDHLDNCPTEAGVKENAGCPAGQRQLVALAAGRLQILEKVYFDAGKATVQRRSNALLENVARVLNAHPELAAVRVEGHTDSSGDAEQNTALSRTRAEAVKAALVKAGVAEGRLQAVGYGPSRPMASNDTREGREANRRVEFTLGAQ